MQFNKQLLDELLAPGISSFAIAKVPELTGISDQREHWLQNLFLNSLLGSRYSASGRQAVVTFIFRTQIALRNYELGREKTLACVDAFKPGLPATKLYFEALSHWETVVINIQIAMDVVAKFFDPSSASSADIANLRKAANRVKHYAEDIVNGLNDPSLTLPMWLVIDGLATRTARITFSDLADTLTEMSNAAQMLEAPRRPI